MDLGGADDRKCWIFDPSHSFRRAIAPAARLARCLNFIQEPDLESRTWTQSLDPSFKIVIVDKNPIRAAILEDGLREAGHVQVVRIDETSHLLQRIYSIDPDVILIDLE